MSVFMLRILFYHCSALITNLKGHIYLTFALQIFLMLLSRNSKWYISQFSSVAQLCLTLCNPINHSTPALPVHHHLPEFTQTHVCQVSDAIQPWSWFSKKPLDESERGEWKIGLKLSIQKTKIMASGPITLWQIDGETIETVRDYFLGLQDHCRWWMQPWN